MAYLTAMLPVVSYQIADSIDVKSFKTTFSEGIYHSDADELFYKMGPESYVYVFKYGVVCFLNVDEHTCNSFSTRSHHTVRTHSNSI